MVKKEFYAERKDGVILLRSFSDKSLKINKVGTEETYNSAIDVESAEYEYEETDIPIDVKEGD